jgi:hypothetical protein
MRLTRADTVGGVRLSVPWHLRKPVTARPLGYRALKIEQKRAFCAIGAIEYWRQLKCFCPLGSPQAAPSGLRAGSGPGGNRQSWPRPALGASPTKKPQNNFFVQSPAIGAVVAAGAGRSLLR